MGDASTIEILGTLFFGLGVLHTFFVHKFLQLSHKFPKESPWHSVFHLLGEIEVVFAFWAALFMACFVGIEGWHPAIEYQQSLNFVEPFFIFAIMVVCSTRPVLFAARSGISTISKVIRLLVRTPQVHTDLFVILFFGSLAGSFITEPAAMTVAALMLNSMLKESEERMRYFLLAVLFVNISIGGTLTAFAAPPVLMVAQAWGWDSSFVFTHFGWKSLIAVGLNSILFVVLFGKKLKESFFSLEEVNQRLDGGGHSSMPMTVVGIHLLFVLMIVLTGHYQNAFLGIFLFFLGVATATQRYQDRLRLKESLLVSLFLGGIIQFGAFQKWWLQPLLSRMEDVYLYLGATALTAVTDNAALTYLGTQVEGLSEASKFALVAGAVAGGGLTIIANAPNAAGYSILAGKFPTGVSPVKLLIASSIPTLVAVSCLWFL